MADENQIGSSTQVPEIKTKEKYILLGIIAAILLTPFVVFFLFHIYFHSQINSNISMLKALGYPTTIEEVQQSYDLGLTEANRQAFSQYKEAIAIYDENIDAVEEFLPIVGNFKAIRQVKLTAQNLAAMKIYLENNKEYISRLKALSKSDFKLSFNFKSDYEKDFQSFERTVETLILDAIYAAYYNDSNRAAESLIAALKMSRACRELPGFVHHSVITFYYCTIVYMQNIFSEVQFTGDQLAEIDAALAELEQIDFKNSIKYAAGLSWQYLKVSDDNFGYLNSVEYKPLYWLTLRYDRDFLYVMKNDRDLLALPDDSFPSLAFACERSKEITNEVSGTKFDIKIHVLHVCGADFTASSIISAAENKALIRCARMAVAIERYTLKNGSLPDKIDAVAPDFVPAALVDPFSNNRLKFKKTPFGYVVYSVGPDFKDNDGSETKNDILEQDIPFYVELISPYLGNNFIPGIDGYE